MAQRHSLQEQADADNVNVFDDEFEDDGLDGAVADGFRPGGHGRDEEEDDDGHETWNTSIGHVAVLPTSTHSYSADSGAGTQVSTRNSIRKDRRLIENPFASAEDSGEGDSHGPSLSFEPESENGVHRTISSASSRHFARAASPRFGSGPSHPYTMYPQGTVARTASVATTSTTRPSHRHSMSSQPGPQHPYTMYPQGVEEELDEGDEVDRIAPNPVPMGFLAVGQAYQRRVGPDGEEQDIIGDLGHTEQLPPYSRYPEEGPEKVPLLAPEAPTPSHSRVPVAGTDPTMPLMHTAIAPLAPSRSQSPSDSATLVPTSRSTRSTRRSSRSSHDFIYDEKTWKQKSWKQRWRTRYFKVPFWLCAVIVFVLVLISSILGGVIGRFVENVRRHRLSMSGPTTSLLDASAIATPTNALPATGTYKLALSTPTQAHSGCLVNPAQVNAWSCELAGPPGAALVVESPPGTNKTGAFIYYASDSNQVYYGAQAASLQTTFAPFLAVIDNASPGSGPAYYFQQFFDKQVVLPESAFAVANGKIKKDVVLNDQWFQQRRMVRPGQKPWLCIWNQTFLEGFVYVAQHIASSYSLATPTSSPTAPGGPLPTPPQPSGNAPLMTTTLTLASSTATYAGPSAGYASWSTSVSDPQKQKSNSHLRVHDRSSEDEYDVPRVPRDTTWDNLSMLPYAAKIEERRLPGNPNPAYCQQYQILDNGQWSQYPDGSSTPVVITLDEQDPSLSSYQNRDGLANSRRSMTDPWLRECHCEWLSGQ